MQHALRQVMLQWTEVAPSTCLCRCLQRAEEELQLPHLAAYARLALANFGLRHHPSPSGGGNAEAPASSSQTAGKVCTFPLSGSR